MGGRSLKAAVQLASVRDRGRIWAGRRLKPMKPITLAAMATLVLAPPALAQTTTPDTRFEATTLDLSASGEVHVAPDMATISLGVSSQAPTAADAMAATNAAMAKVVAAVKAAGIEDRWIQTSAVTLSP